MASAAPLLTPDLPDDAQEDTIPLLGEQVEVAEEGTRLVLFPALQQRLATLNQIVNLGKSIAIVIGDFGSGKSLLSNYCRTDLWHDKKQAHLSARAGLPMSQLTRELTRTLGVHGSGGNITFQRIARLLVANAGRLHHVLVIDDANNLTRDVLLSLLRLKQALAEKQADFNIVLFAEPEIKHSLIHESLEDYSDGWAAFVYLPRLGESDVADYVRDRRQLTGSRHPEPGDAAIRALYEQSAGLPLRINELLDKGLLEQVAETSVRGKNRRLLTRALAAGLAAVLMVCFLWPRQVDQLLAQLF